MGLCVEREHGSLSSSALVIAKGGGGIFNIWFWLNISGYAYHNLNITSLESVTCYASSVVFIVCGSDVINCNS